MNVHEKLMQVIFTNDKKLEQKIFYLQIQIIQIIRFVLQLIYMDQLLVNLLTSHITNLNFMIGLVKILEK